MPFIIDKAQLEKVQDLALFYPSSGRDLLVPIRIFSPYVTDFWFVDCAYFRDRSADKQRAVLQGDNGYELLSTNLVGPSRCSSLDGDITPCILTETYRHLKTDRLIRIHRRRGYGFSALRNEQAIGKLGVFFYRGDSFGVGGSGNLWLKQEHLNEIFGKLIDGGLLVLDGSDGRRYDYKGDIYKEICKYAHQHPSMTPDELIASMNAATDGSNREYKCVGYAGMKYGPTMIWQVRHNCQVK